MGGFLNTWLMVLVLCCFGQLLSKRFVRVQRGAVHANGLKIMKIREDSVCSVVMQISPAIECADAILLPEISPNPNLASVY